MANIELNQEIPQEVLANTSQPIQEPIPVVSPEQPQEPPKQSFIKNIFSMLCSTSVLCLISILLSWVKSIGIHWAILVPLNFLTGATLGSMDENMIGGTIGKTIIMLFLNGFILTFVNHKGTIMQKLGAAFGYYKTSLVNMIPFVLNFKEFNFKDKLSLYTNTIGIGIGIMIYSFITGTGGVVNTLPIIIITVALANEAVENRGIFIALLNLLLSLFGAKRISRKPIDGIVNGAALGSLLSIIYAFFYGNIYASFLIGMLLFIIGAILYIQSRTKLIKEMELCDDI